MLRGETEMIQNEYDWNNEVQLKLVALLVREPEISLGLIKPSYFKNFICLDIARVTKEGYTGKDLKSFRLEEGVLKALMWETLKEQPRSKARKLKKVYMEQVHKIFEISLKNKEILLDLARRFAMESRYREALIGAEKDLNAGNYDRILKRIQDTALPDAQLAPSVKLPVIPFHHLIYGEETIVAGKLILDWSPQQISGWLKIQYPADESLRVSRETIYRSLFIQARGVLKKELLGHLRSKRRIRRSQHAHIFKDSRGQIVDAISIRERPAEIADRAASAIKA
jgi:hypothetical protein